MHIKSKIYTLKKMHKKILCRFFCDLIFIMFLDDKKCALFVQLFFRRFFVNLFLSKNDKNKKIKTLILKGLRGYPLTHDFTCKV